MWRPRADHEQNLGPGRCNVNGELDQTCAITELNAVQKGPADGLRTDRSGARIMDGGLPQGHARQFGRFRRCNGMRIAGRKAAFTRPFDLAGQIVLIAPDREQAAPALPNIPVRKLLIGLVSTAT